MYYLDSSAWVKRYVMEIGSGRVRALFLRSEQIASASLGYVETVAALSRRLLEPDAAIVASKVRADWQSMIRLHIVPAIADKAAELARQYKLRGADAVHLAAALSLQNSLSGTNEPLILVASDAELLEAACQERLAVEDPR